MDRILQELRQEVQCPLCLQHMTPPITVCCNCHLICSACKPGLQDCHICHGKLTNIRNLAMERFAEKLAETVRELELVPASEPGQPSVDFVAEKDLKQLQCWKCKQYMTPPFMHCGQCGAFICTFCNPVVKPHECVKGNKQIFLIRNGETEALMEISDSSKQILQFRMQGSLP